MQVFYSDTSFHSPEHEIFNGEKTPHQEIPDRVDTILQALRSEKKHSLQIIEETSFPVPQDHKVLALAQNIHKKEYLDFLVASQEWGREYQYPSVFPYFSAPFSSQKQTAQRGMFSFDLYTPIHNKVLSAAIQSGMVACAAAEYTYQKKENSYGLCRPPGHHAEPGKMGGYCYLNNGALAIEQFRLLGAKRIALLDVDFHHGNGAERIYGADENVLTVSIHADPNEIFPFFSGDDNNEYVQNRNFPLPLGTDNQSYNATLSKALHLITEFQPEFLVVCFGADIHKDDPIGGFTLTTSYLEQMGKEISSLQIPCTVVQEGGYNTALLGKNVCAFSSGIMEM